MKSTIHTNTPQALRPGAMLRGKLLPMLDGDALLAFVDRRVAEHADFHDGWSAIRERRAPLPLALRKRRPALVISELDALRLERLLDRLRHETDPAQLASLRAELERAAIVSPHAVPEDVVTMNSCVLCEDRETRVRSRLKLVYPNDIGRERPALSVLSAMGTALLGASVGQPLALPEDHAFATRLHVRALPYQPEREGHFHV